MGQDKIKIDKDLVVEKFTGGTGSCMKSVDEGQEVYVVRRR